MKSNIGIFQEINFDNYLVSQKKKVFSFQKVNIIFGAKPYPSLMFKIIRIS